MSDADLEARMALAAILRDVLSVEKVLEAYRATGMRPIRKEWGRPGEHCGCPAYVVATHMSGGNAPPFGAVGHVIMGGGPVGSYAAGLVESFAEGVDGTDAGDRDSAERAAWDHGVVVWAAVVAAGLADEEEA